MTMAILIPELLLAVWFFGCICTYKLGRFVLVEGEGIKSPEFVMLCLYGTGMLLFWLIPDLYHMILHLLILLNLVLTACAA